MFDLLLNNLSADQLVLACCAVAVLACFLLVAVAPSASWRRQADLGRQGAPPEDMDHGSGLVPEDAHVAPAQTTVRAETSSGDQQRAA